MKDLYKELTGEQITALLHLRGAIEALGNADVEIQSDHGAVLLTGLGWSKSFKLTVDDIDRLIEELRK